MLDSGWELVMEALLVYFLKCDDGIGEVIILLGYIVTVFALIFDKGLEHIFEDDVGNEVV